MAHNISYDSTSQPNNDIPVNNQVSSVGFTFGSKSSNTQPKTNTGTPMFSFGSTQPTKDEADAQRRRQQRQQQMDDLEEFSKSKSLALGPLKEKIEVVFISLTSSPSESHFDIKLTESINYHFRTFESSEIMFNICANENITVEIVEYLLKIFENDDLFNSECLLHEACKNKHCPTEVIELLIDKYTSTLGHMREMSPLARFGSIFVQGLPLTYYLSRESSYIDIKAVKKLVTAYPEALTTRLFAVDNITFVMPLVALVFHDELHHLVEVFRLLVETNPSAVQLQSRSGFTLLHYIVCAREINITTKSIIQLLLEAWPEGPLVLDAYGALPLHFLCSKKYDIEEEEVLLDIARLLIDAYPDSLRQNNSVGKSPLHLATSLSSPALCQLIVSYDLDLVKLPTRYGHLPIHIACAHNAGIDTVRYLLELFPDSIRIRDCGGCHPIHIHIDYYNGKDQCQILRFLLERHPDSASEPITASVIEGWGDPNYEGRLPLHLACIRGLCLKDLMMVFNAYPEAINIKDGTGKIPSDYLQVSRRKSFMFAQLENAAISKDERVRVADASGRLPLHTALYDSECLGGIKLLVNGYHEALQQADGEGLYPLHIACMKGLLDIVKYLLEEEASVVSKRTLAGKLPVHLLCEASDGSLEYTDTIWNLLMAYPEAVMTCGGLDFVEGPNVFKFDEATKKKYEEEIAAAADMPWPPDDDEDL